MDHNRAIVYEHCKSVVYNLLLALSVQSEQIWLSEMLLSYVDWDNSKLSTKIRQERDNNGGNLHSQSFFTESLNDNTNSSSNSNEILPETENPINLTREEVVQRFINYLNSKKSFPLWAYEDITAQVHTIRSALQLTQFVQWIVTLFRACVPHAMLEERWMELALRITLSCSSRHYAGRSLQVKFVLLDRKFKYSRWKISFCFSSDHSSIEFTIEFPLDYRYSFTISRNSCRT